jgi:hypothetical protein
VDATRPPPCRRCRLLGLPPEFPLLPSRARLSGTCLATGVVSTAAPPPRRNRFAAASAAAAAAWLIRLRSALLLLAPHVRRFLHRDLRRWRAFPGACISISCTRRHHTRHRHVYAAETTGATCPSSPARSPLDTGRYRRRRLYRPFRRTLMRTVTAVATVKAGPRRHDRTAY